MPAQPIALRPARLFASPKERRNLSAEALRRRQRAAAVSGEFQGALVNSALGGAGQLATSLVTGGVLAVSGSSIVDTTKLVIDGGSVHLTNTEIVNSLYFGTVQHHRVRPRR